MDDELKDELKAMVLWETLRQGLNISSSETVETSVGYKTYKGLYLLVKAIVSEK